MKLMFSPLSPYVRKVMVVVHEHGLADRVELVPVNTRNEPEKITPANPLGKVPALILDNGTAIYDSPVICEYLDSRFGHNSLLPASGDARWDALTRAALADGMTDAALLVRHERARPAERQSAEWIDWQLRKVFTALDRFDALAPGFGNAFDMGHVALACSLGYMPLRLPELVGLPRWPRLAAWLAQVGQRESLQRTMPVV